ncbi:DUF4252 domain-containing protein [Galbibacter sp. EGI 63066]|uniref:DUF4252 domain-containing protein n=1 Tax=Galbibacter sp. EGI 63066 TaxID=2993559 RepID=UPI0022494B80|nr:DUF4252 domain-containing protein [Galbibacter sp. EGI 63066]MCX2680438.1 DUF4252 domain-containing protein [Galbibacter sp. EGI 63066]
MKKLTFLAFACIFLVSCGASTPYDSFRKENKEAIAFSLSASNFLASFFVDKEDMKELKQVVGGISKYRILVGNEENAAELDADFKRFVKRKGYESLFYINDKGETINLYFYKKRNKVRELIFKVGGSDDFVIISAEGNIKFKDIDRLVNRAVVDAH